MRLACFFLLMLITAVGAIAQTEDLIQAVPTTNPAYAQVYQLNKVGIIPTLPEKLRKTDTPLTHYDIAFLLVEPLERCSAFVETQESPSTVLPEQRRRAEMAYLTFSKIAPEDFDRALTSLSQLLRAFGTDVELLSPGLSSRASAALHKLTLPAFRPWVKNSALSPVVHLSITPHAQTDSINDGPLAFISPTHGGRYALFARTSKGGDQQSVVGTRPVTSLEAAADVAFGRFKLYGSIGTLPGQDPTMMILRPDGTGKAMLGLQVDVLQIRDLGISGIFEFHIMRSGDPTNLDTNTGAVGGVGLNW